MKKIYSIDKLGNKKEYQVILTYHSDEFNKNYIVYTNNNYNESNELEIFINEYDKTKPELISKEIENKEEYTKIKTIINSILLTMKNETDKLS